MGCHKSKACFQTVVPDGVTGMLNDQKGDVASLTALNQQSSIGRQAPCSLSGSRRASRFRQHAPETTSYSPSVSETRSLGETTTDTCSHAGHVAASSVGNVSERPRSRKVVHLHDDATDVGQLTHGGIKVTDDHSAGISDKRSDCLVVAEDVPSVKKSRQTTTLCEHTDARMFAGAADAAMVESKSEPSAPAPVSHSQLQSASGYNVRSPRPVPGNGSNSGWRPLTAPVAPHPPPPEVLGVSPNANVNYSLDLVNYESSTSAFLEQNVEMVLNDYVSQQSVPFCISPASPARSANPASPGTTPSAQVPCFGWLMASEDAASPSQQVAQYCWTQSRCGKPTDLKLSDTQLLSIYGRKMAKAPCGLRTDDRSGVHKIGSLRLAIEEAVHAAVPSACLQKTFSNYQAMMRHQQSIVPPHLQCSDVFSEIILESSIIVGCLGQMLMLPWNDADEDVSNNFWIGSAPPHIRILLKTYRSNRLCPSDMAVAHDQRQQRGSLQSRFECTVENTIGSRRRSPSNDDSGNLRPQELRSSLTRSFMAPSDSAVMKDTESSVSHNPRGFATVANHGSSQSPLRLVSLLDDAPVSITVNENRQFQFPSECHRWLSSRNCLWPTLPRVVVRCGAPGSRSGVASGPLCRDHVFPAQVRRTCGSESRSDISNCAGASAPAPPLPGVAFDGEARHGSCQPPTTAHQHSPHTLLGDACRQQHPSLVCRANSILLPSVSDTASQVPAPDLSESGCFFEGWSLEDGRWTDPDGYIALSQKQKSKFYAWKRITDLFPVGGEPPCVIYDRPKSRSIRQGFVGDCSFLSSLAVLAQYENTHHVPVLSGVIFPQRPHPTQRGHITPIINPTGFYACRVFFNGVPRKVLLDDYVPVRKDGKILSAHSANKCEFWVSLLEKCFVKLMGGSYFMQGSNPGADLYHLTGWIPETIPFRVDIHTGSPDSHRPVVTGGYEAIDHAADPKWKAVWDQLFDGLRYGKCVACLGTSEVADAAPSGLDYPEGVSQSSGIVARHAYSVLGFRQINGKRLLFVKNPWCCIRWRGDYSPYDEHMWTDRLEAELNYNRKRSAATDDGCFWIEWSDIVKWFSHLYICWTPSCFPFQAEVHSKWEQSQRITHSILPDDSHVVAFNPQFLVSVHPSEEQQDELVELWVFLSRHVRERKRDLSLKYLAVHVHAGTERVTCPPPPLKQGIYSNGECTLLKLSLDLSAAGGNRDATPTCPRIPCATVPLPIGFQTGNDDGSPATLVDRHYVLVVSQYSQKEEFNFTIKTCSSIRTTLTPLPPLIPSGVDTVSRYLKGSWDASVAGGCSNSLWSYFTNPHVRLYLPYDCEILLFLECPQERSVNLRLFKGPSATARLLRSGKAISSGPYRSGCCVIRKPLQAGCYTLIVSTFRQGETADFQVALHVWNIRPDAVPRSPHRQDALVGDDKPQFQSSEIVLDFLPYPFVVPPPIGHFFYREIYSRDGFCEQTLLHGFGGVLRMSRVSAASARFVNVALQLKTQRLSPSSIYPSIVVYRKRLPHDPPLSLHHTDIVLPPSDLLVPVARSDLEGGQGDPSRPFSSAAQDLYKKQSISTLSHVCLDMENAPYYAVITAAVLLTVQGSPCAVVSADSPKAAHPLPMDATSGDFTLHIIGDHPLELIR